jgi:hypothetical protein
MKSAMNYSPVLHPLHHTRVVHVQALSLHLLCERRIGKASFWREYIRQLPDQVRAPSYFV